MSDYNFYSIDRLIEFGMGMAMAQQMIKVMNETMQTIYVPGSINTISAPQSSTIYVAIDGNSVGPITDREFLTLVIEHKVSKENLVWMPGMLGWKPIENVPNILKIMALLPPPLPKT